jgi:hypothetical protein
VLWAPGQPKLKISAVAKCDAASEDELRKGGYFNAQLRFAGG